MSKNRDMKGREKAAILLVALGPESVAGTYNDWNDALRYPLHRDARYRGRDEKVCSIGRCHETDCERYGHHKAEVDGIDPNVLYDRKEDQS